MCTFKHIPFLCRLGCEIQFLSIFDNPDQISFNSIDHLRMSPQLAQSKSQVLDLSKDDPVQVVDPRLDLIKRLKEQAFTLIDCAISIETEFITVAPATITSSTNRMDELTNIRIAREFYKRGLMRMEEVSKAPLPVHDSSKGEARSIKDKSKQTMEMIRERVKLLQKREEDLVMQQRNASLNSKSITATSTPTKRQVTSGAAREVTTCSQDMFGSIVEQIIPAGSIHVSWESIAGLQVAKQVLSESVILPLRRPDIFTGLRSPVKGKEVYLMEFRSVTVWSSGNGKDTFSQGCCIRGTLLFHLRLCCHLDIKICGGE